MITRHGTTRTASAALLLAIGSACADAPELPRAPHGRTLDAPPLSARGFELERSYSVPEANQGVAVDERHFYAVGNRVIAKYERDTGEKVAEWRGPDDGPIIHLNSCLATEARLVCAHSNHPGVPMLSSVELWSTDDLQHLQSRSLGVYEGSLTWAIPHDGSWWMNFANYSNQSGTPGRGSEWTTLVRFDGQWNRETSYSYPVTLIDRLVPNSLSGGNWTADGQLWVTGHDDPEVYVLQLPEKGSVLEWVETIPVPMHGQAWVFDPVDPDKVWGIVRSSREVVVGVRSRAP